MKLCGCIVKTLSESLTWTKSLNGLEANEPTAECLVWRLGFLNEALQSIPEFTLKFTQMLGTEP